MLMLLISGTRYRKEGDSMTDLNALNAKIKDSGMTIEAIAEKANMKRYTLDRRLRGEGEFTASEIVGLTKALRLKLSERNKIFLT